MLEMTPRKQTPTPHGAPAVTDVDWVVRLDEPAALNADRVGAKAAALARATKAGMPALPGFVISTEGTAALTDDDKRQQALCILLEAWTASAGVERALVVRSSSTIEDGASSSMAGRFESVLDVTGWDAFVEAVDDVIDSAILEDGDAAPMAVLVQPMLRPRLGGVLFGADPMTGRTDRLLLTAVEGGPHQLVSGEVDGIQLGLTTAGKRVGKGDSLPGLGKAQFAALAALARRAAEVFGGPQDIEWAIDGDAVVLLQSRPITTLEPPAVGVGPVLGPGPVAETLPGTVAALEASLWVTPLRDAIEAALQLTAAASRRTIERSPIVTIVDGQVVADLELLGVHRKRGFFRKLDPRPGARRLSASWRVGRLQASLPSLADDLVHSTDEALLDVPPLAELTDGELVAVLRAAPAHLVNLHTFEVLAGMLAPSKATGGPTGAMAALHALADGRRRGLSATKRSWRRCQSSCRCCPRASVRRRSCLRCRRRCRTCPRVVTPCWKREKRCACVPAGSRSSRRVSPGSSVSASPLLAACRHRLPCAASRWTSSTRSSRVRTAADRERRGRCAGRRTAGPVPPERRRRRRPRRHEGSRRRSARRRWRARGWSGPPWRRSAGRRGPRRSHALAGAGAVAAEAARPRRRIGQRALAPGDPRP